MTNNPIPNTKYNISHTTPYDLIIIGGGPAGISATVYSARKQLKTLFITSEWGGQSTVSSEIYNWIGTPKVSGADFGEMLKKHAEEYQGEFLDIKEGEKAIEIKKENDIFVIKTETGSTFQSKAILITTGSGRRKLEIPGAKEFEQKGITYCASCDGPVFAGLDVIVVGGGNAGFETSAQLLAYAKSVTLLQRGSEYKADKITVEKVLAHPNMTGILNANIKEVKGESFVTSVVYTDTIKNEDIEIPAGGVFVEIGQIPNTDFVKDIVELDQYKKIIVDPMRQRASLNGIWSAGDATNGLYHQNNIASGDAVKAIEDIYLWLKTK